MRTTFFLMLAGACVIANAQFAGGNLVVRIVGDGNAKTTGAIPTSLRQYTTTGAQVGADVLLTNLANGRNLCCSYGETSETALEISDDNRFLMVSGYDVPSRDPGFDSFLSNRAIGRISLANSSVVLSNTFVPDIGDGTRGISSPDGDQFLVCGGDMGLLSGTFSTSPTQILPNAVSSRHVHKIGSAWYFLGSNAGPNGTNGVATWDGVN